MFNLFRWFGCSSRGHDWINSKKKRGFMTCKRCGLRRKWR